MRSKWMKLFAALFAVALLAAACGSDDADSGATDSGADDAAADALAAAEAAKAEAEAAAADAEARAAAAEAEAAAAGDSDAEPMREFEGKIIRITGPERSPAEWGSIDAAMDPFEEETGLTIIYTGSADWEGEINVQLAAGNPPDISIFPQPGKLADFARDGLVVEIPQEVQDSVRANWGDGVWGFGTVDGAQFGMPSKNDLKSIVWHKPARFAELGYDIPQTWDELKELTNTMIADGVTPWCVGIESGQATGWTFTDWTEDLMLRFEGAEAYDQWITNELKFSDERVTAIFDEILDLWNTEGAVFAGGGSIASTHHSSDNAEGLIADNCMMVRQASFFSSFLPEGTSTEVDVFYFPPVGDSRPVLTAGTLVGSFKDSPEVWAVVEYMGTADYANRRQAAQKEALGGEGQLSGFNSANQNADRSLWEPLEQSFLTILDEAEVLRFDGSDLMPSDVGAGTFWTEATAMVNGEKDSAAAAAAIDASWPTE